MGFLYVYVAPRFFMCGGTEILRAGWSGVGAVCVVLLRGCCGGIFRSSFKNGVFLTSPKCQGCANAAELLMQRLRRLHSSDKPLRAAQSWHFGEVRNISIFSNGAENTPTAAPKKNNTHWPPPRTILHAKSPGGIGGRKEGW